VAVTAVQVGGTYAGARWQPDRGSVSTLAYVLLAVGGASLLARRRYPVGVLAVTLVTTLWASAGNEHAIYLALIVAFFTATLARKRAAAIASLVIGYAASVWPWLIGEPGHPSAMFAVGLAAGLIFLLSAAELIRSRSQRAAAVQRSREEELRRRASEERMRMARDLQALVELRSVLGVLRDVDESAPRTPSPGLGRLGDLADSAAAAGLTVRIDRAGTSTPLPADVDLAAYRIVQEALTNSARHSTGATATVRVVHGDDALIVEVDDDGIARSAGRTGDRASGQGTGRGNGIAGMTERAKVLGGTLAAGPRPEGGFRVRAWLPIEGSEP
jgi:signal transduction histidine kinase